MAGTTPYCHDERVFCDDANPSDIRVYCDEGIRAFPARKGNMRKQSYTWLAGLREIWIDPNRCPHAFEEFSLCEYAKDRDGNWVDDFPDGNDHSIDAVRYAMMEDIIRGAYGREQQYVGLS
jgi:phage terminase large subunit